MYELVNNQLYYSWCLTLEIIVTEKGERTAWGQLCSQLIRSQHCHVWKSTLSTTFPRRLNLSPLCFKWLSRVSVEFLSGNTIITGRDIHPGPFLSFGVETNLDGRGQSGHTNSAQTSWTQGYPWFGFQPPYSWVGYCFMHLVVLGKWNTSEDREGKGKSC